MSHATTTQDYLRIYTTFSNLDTSLIDTVKIKYINPKKQHGEFNGTLNVEEHMIYHDIQKGSPLLLAGDWTFWSHATLTDGREIPGAPFKIKIVKEGQI